MLYLWSVHFLSQGGDVLYFRDTARKLKQSSRLKAVTSWNWPKHTNFSLWCAGKNAMLHTVEVDRHARGCWVQSSIRSCLVLCYCWDAVLFYLSPATTLGQRLRRQQAQVGKQLLARARQRS